MLGDDRRRSAGNFTILDAFCLVGLIVLWFLLLVWRNDALPLQPWDESRNAVNAYNMANGQGWLVPTYEGAPDHWQEKPPLLDWCVVGFMRLGLPFLLAMRMPSFLAVLSTLLVIWAVCRYTLRDSVAGVIGGLLLLSSKVYLGIHIGRTGDYDALLALFALCCTLAFWFSVRDGPLRVGWFAACGVAVVLSVMTKGVAGLFVPAGLAVFAAMTGSLWKVLSEWRVWLISLAAVGLCLAYYLVREQFDPGYLLAVWDVELGGRFTVVSERHSGPVYFYLAVLISGYTAGLILLPLSVVPILRNDRLRRSLVLVCLVTALVVFGVLTLSKTKIYWYVAPVVPLLALATAVGVADLSRVAGLAARVAPALILALLLVGVGSVFYQNQHDDPYIANYSQNGQYYYGQLFERVERQYHERDLLVLDSGLIYQGGDADFNPVLRFYADRAKEQGLLVAIVDADALAPDMMTATCDPAFVPRLQAQPGFELAFKDKWCVAGRTKRAASG